MFERDIYEEEVGETILTGEIVEKYEDDKPYPSCLALKFFNNKPLHVVYAINKEDNEYIVIAAYYLAKEKWSKDFKERTKKRNA